MVGMSATHLRDLSDFILTSSACNRIRGKQSCYDTRNEQFMFCLLVTPFLRCLNKTIVIYITKIKRKKPSKVSFVIIKYGKIFSFLQLRMNTSYYTDVSVGLKRPIMTPTPTYRTPFIKTMQKNSSITIDHLSKNTLECLHRLQKLLTT